MAIREHEGEPDDDEQLDEQSREPSRNRLRNQAREFIDLAEELTKGKHPSLPNPPFDEQLREGIADAQRFSKNARSRQIRRVAQLLRGAGSMDELRAALEGRTPAMLAKQALEQSSEQWRARLIEQGDVALAELLAGHPSADRQKLRQLVRQASKVPPDARAKRAATALIRMVRGLLAAGVGAEVEAEAEAGPEAEADEVEVDPSTTSEP